MFDSSSGDPIPKPKSSKRMPSGARRNISTCSIRAVQPFASGGIRAQPGFCQHQKSWLIDSGTESETTFLGGINLNPHSMVAPGHRGEGQNHDVYIELASFQRWTKL